MFKFRKSKPEKEKKPESQHEAPPKKGWFSRLKDGLTKSRQNLTDGLSNLLLGKKSIDDELYEELETRLLLADVGVETTQLILDNLTQQISRKELKDEDALLTQLKQTLTEILAPCEKPLAINATPFVMLMVGINGAGKTTSIAKLAHYYQQQHKKCILAAGDTFRAAAIEQLQVWGERNDVPVIAQQHGADSASVAFDAVAAAQARGYDILITDTAGRLHTQSHLMEELKKIKRVIKKQDEQAPHATLLVLDASLGQNALQQAKQFHDAIGIDGLIMTKLDGSAKGGIMFAIANQLKLPIYFIGIGEKMDDLKPFHSDEFIDALFSE